MLRTSHVRSAKKLILYYNSDRRRIPSPGPCATANRCAKSEKFTSSRAIKARQNLMHTPDVFRTSHVRSIKKICRRRNPGMAYIRALLARSTCQCTGRRGVGPREYRHAPPGPASKGRRPERWARETKPGIPRPVQRPTAQARPGTMLLSHVRGLGSNGIGEVVGNGVQGKGNRREGNLASKRAQGWQGRTGREAPKSGTLDPKLTVDESGRCPVGESNPCRRMQPCSPIMCAQVNAPAGPGGQTKHTAAQRSSRSAGLHAASPSLCASPPGARLTCGHGRLPVRPRRGLGSWPLASRLPT